jgi:hypothetical protein
VVNKDIKAVRARSPFPWRTEHVMNGVYRMVDANGDEVPLFAMFGLAEVITEHMALIGAATSAARQPVPPVL